MGIGTTILFDEGAASVMDTAQTALTSGLTDVATGMGSVITNVLPVALGIVGAVMVVTFGIKIFRRLTGKTA